MELKIFKRSRICPDCGKKMEQLNRVGMHFKEKIKYFYWMCECRSTGWVEYGKRGPLVRKAFKPVPYRKGMNIFTYFKSLR